MNDWMDDTMKVQDEHGERLLDWLSVFEFGDVDVVAQPDRGPRVILISQQRICAEITMDSVRRLD